MRLRDAYAPLLLALGAVLLAPLSLSAQTLSTFDTFTSEEIDGDRWAGIEQVIGYGSHAGGWVNGSESQWTQHPEFSIVNTAVDRRVVGGQLRLQLSTRGGTHDNTMAPGHGRLALRSRSVGNSVTRAQASITVMAAEPRPCRSTGESRTRAQLYLDVVRDASDRPVVFATLSLQRSSFGGDRIVAVLSRCRAVPASPPGDGCRVAEDLDWVVFNRSWMARRAHSLMITHQPATDRVVFSVSGGGVPAESRTLRYSSPSDGTLVGQGFALMVENSPSNCPAAGGSPSERVEVTMDARFDNVRVNTSAVPVD